MKTALLIDFGSTYTKLRAFDLDKGMVIGTSQGPSTVTTDVSVGMNLALDQLVSRVGKLPKFTYRLASSSAAGGLRIVAIGLVRELTLEAARRAALGAGAKIVGSFAHKMNTADLKALVQMNPDIVLLSGGTDGGDVATVIHNANLLGNSDLNCPIIFAGNRSASDDVAERLNHKLYIQAANVMPELNVLNIEPVREVIRQVFIDRIVHAKGIDRAQTLFDSVLMPTPSAVLEAARLLADGHGSEAGLGDLMILDPGGATTDVHSVSVGAPTNPSVVMRGLPEPRVKRTVEGDLGMRHNASVIVDVVGIDRISQDAGIGVPQLQEMLHRFSSKADLLPATSDEQKLDEVLAEHALRLSIARHCGKTEIVYTANGPVTAQEGKDLTQIKTLIGTGGVIAHNQSARSLLRKATQARAPGSLQPENPNIFIDKNYLLYSCGLLSAVEPVAALEICKANLVEQE